MRLDPGLFEVISFDSRQVYKHLSVGTSKPSPNDQSKIYHHLIDFLEPSEKITAKEFSEMAKQSFSNIIGRSKIPIITCGTGFYLKAFLYGMYPIPGENPAIRENIKSLNNHEKYKMLEELDPHRALQISPSDLYRVERSLEIALSGIRWSERESPLGGILEEYPDIECIGLFIDEERHELYERINNRAKKMIYSGLLDETGRILEEFGENCPALNSLGYNFAVENIQGKITLECLENKFSQSHRNYAKKQITWFKKEKILKRISRLEALALLKKIEYQG